MKIRIFESPEELGREASAFTAEILRRSIADRGKARLVLSTGASQFETLSSLLKEDIDWEKVEVFHLDEYINLSESHPASFRKYLKERFANHVKLKAMHYVNGEGNVSKNIEELSRELRKEPVDIGLIGIGENAHIAFNDPPADFNTREAYIIVNLNEDCKKQQVREGWFPSVDSVPKQAVSMTPYQIMQCNVIVSCVPHKVKAKAIKDLLENDVTNMVPATLLKNHKNVHIFLDRESASLADKDIIKRYI